MAHRELACAQCIGADRLRPHDPVEQSGEQPLARLDELGVDVRRVELAQVDAGRGWAAKQPSTARTRSPFRVRAVSEAGQAFRSAALEDLDRHGADQRRLAGADIARQHDVLTPG